ncbi:MAG: phospholipid carrier-dependent glycosyltransferase [Deltaproteobacteria bacterium]|nr:phospholipid carrier-dependent glycosyltransferase [Deltaproteobacteria bacterium]
MRKYAIPLIGLFLILYILPLGWRPLAIPDETRYAEIPREMIASGDWVVPRLNGLRYFEKPVLGYWLNALSITLFGENAFAVRLPSALATGITALMVFFLVRRFGRGSEAGILGAAAYLTCILVLAVGVISILDSMLTLFLTGAMLFFFFAHREDHPLKRTGFLALFGLCCGLAFLVKGFLAFAVPCITIVPFLIWERRLKDLLRLPWIPIAALLLVTLPWCILIHLREGDFWNYFFWTEHIKRFISPIPGQHPKPFWYFLPLMAGGALPWTILIPAIFWEIRAGVRRKDPLLRFALCWFLFPFLFFSACSGKLVPYILPCFPPLVIIIALGLTDYFEKGKKRAFNICACAMAVIAGVFVIALLLNQTTHLLGTSFFKPSETWKWVMAAAGFLTWAGGALFSIIYSDWRKKLILYVLAPLPILFMGFVALPDEVMEERTPERLLLRNHDKVHADTLVVTGDQLFHAVCWFYKRNDVYLQEGAGELQYGVDHDDSGPPRLLTRKEFLNLIKRNSGKRGVVLIAKTRWYMDAKADLPDPVFEDSDNGFVFLKF